jgi:modulator of FtsH protease HflC
MNRILVGFGVIAAILLIGIANAFYIVRIDRQAIILRFGEFQEVVNSDAAKKKAGLHMKLPFVDEVRLYDKRNLGFELDSAEVTASDQQRLIVDAIARYRIRDPLQFFRTATTEANGEAQLRQRLDAALRNELGRADTPNIISGQRAQLMQSIRTSLGTGMAEFGVEIIDVRIRRADLPEANSERVFERMKSELQQKARQFRAEGEEQYLTIVGDADKQAQVIIAEAQQQSSTLRGEGDAVRNAIYAEAYGRDPEFFSFYRSLEAYDKSIKEGTPLVISPDSQFFRYFGDSRPRN